MVPGSGEPEPLGCRSAAHPRDRRQDPDRIGKRSAARPGQRAVRAWRHIEERHEVAAGSADDVRGHAAQSRAGPVGQEGAAARELKMAIIVALMATLLLSALSAALVLTTSSEALIAA